MQPVQSAKKSASASSKKSKKDKKERKRSPPPPVNDANYPLMDQQSETEDISPGSPSVQQDEEEEGQIMEQDDEDPDATYRRRVIDCNADVVQGLMENPLRMPGNAFVVFMNYVTNHQTDAIEQGSPNIDFADPTANLAAFLKWETNREQTKFIGKEKSGSSEKSGDAPMSTEVTSSDAAVDKSYNQLLAALSKSGKTSIRDKSSAEHVTRTLRAYAGPRFTKPQLSNIYTMMLSDEDKAHIGMIVLDIQRGEEAGSLGIQKWTEAGWCEPASAVPFSELADFIDKIVLPRLNPTTTDEQTIKSRIKSAAEQIARDIASPAFVTDKNVTNNNATKHLVDIFRKVDSDPLKSALRVPSVQDELMDSIQNDLIFRENKGDLNTKNFLTWLREVTRDTTAFFDKTSLKRAMLDYMGRCRDSINIVGSLMHCTQSDAHTLVTKLCNPRVRNDFLNGSNDRSKGANDRSGSPRNERSAKGAEAQRDKNPRARGGNPPPTTNNLPKPVDTNPCPGCGILGKHGEEAAHCPFVKQNHPNANMNVKQKWITSQAGIAAKAQGVTQLTWQRTIDGKEFPMISNYKGGTDQKRTAPPGNQATNGESHSLVHMINGLNQMEGVMHPEATPTTSSKTINPFLTTRITNLINREGRQVFKEIRTVLVDTGAIDSNYISSKMSRALEKSYGIVRMPDVREVKTPDRSASKFYTEGSIDLEIEIYDEIEKAVNTIKLKALIIDSPIDLIIGLPTIRDNNLLLKCMNQILWGTREKWASDKQVTPKQFKEADEKMLNSIVDSILIESEDPSSSELAEANPPTRKEAFTNCVACYTLVTHEECA
jgi:hypothetical protein